MGTGAGREEGILAVRIAEVNTLRPVKMSDCTFGKTQGAEAQEERNGVRTGVHPKGFKVLRSFLMLPLGGSLGTPRVAL